MRLLCLFRLLCLGLAIAGPSVAAQGDVVIIGGNYRLQTSAIWNRMETTRLPGKPIAVFGTASSTPQPTGESLRDDFNGKFGAGTAVYLHVTETNGAADTQAIADQIRTCGGIYFTGGDQRRITAAFYRTNGQPTLALDAIREVHAAGGMVAGSSAGAAVICDPMISGGSSPGGLRYGSSPPSGNANATDIERGLGFIGGAIFDQHFLVRGRLGRLIAAVEGAGLQVGYGIDEDTALAIDPPTGMADVLGSMGVVRVDLTQMVKGASNTRSGVLISYLDVGDRIDMATGAVVPAAGKSPYDSPTRPAATVTSSDIWADTEVWNVLAELIETQGNGIARTTDPFYDVLLRRSLVTQAWRGGTRTHPQNGNTIRAWTILHVEFANVLPGGVFPNPPLETPLELGAFQID